MANYFFIWPDETVEHLADHGLTPEDFENVVSDPEAVTESRSSGLDEAFGYTADGRYIVAIFRMLDFMTVEPITAYEVPEPRIRK
jgi:uncharacterized DUF497 family protein